MEATLQAGGGALEPLRFHLPDGRIAEPFHRAPWIDGSAALDPPLLNHIRGEWPCVPFGVPPEPRRLVPSWQAVAEGPAEPDVEDSAPDRPHGFGANARWRLAREEGALSATVAYPAASAVARLERRVSPFHEGLGVRIALEIVARRPCRTTAGFHPIFRLPGRPGSVRIRPGRFRHGFTYPAPVEPGISRAAPFARFDDLGAVPAADGTRLALDALPLPFATEEIVMLTGSDGRIDLEDTEAGIAYRLEWDASLLPHALIWISNRGRAHAPWAGRNLCLGIEPVASAFDLGAAVSARANPIAALGERTCLALRPDEPWSAAITLRVV
ncbi:MAG TPA: hypothetical protein VHL98_10320 [Microvirga sp.]|nr:hypothetical protein [Microvirga sp.]